MTDITHDIAGLVKTANAITRHPSMGGAMANAQDVLSDMSAALTATHAERDTWRVRIEELEAKLAKVLAVLHLIVDQRGYADDPWGIVQTTLAELEGQGNDH